MANLTRRQWLKVGLAVGGMVTFGLSYRDVAKRAALAAKSTTNHRHDAMLRLLDTVRYPRPG